MELGERLRQARLEAGLSQRALCGDVITRNMLSAIEHGAARPSMGTLQYLAARLGKPVSFFLEESAVVSPNRQTMAAARQHYDSGAFGAALQALEDYQSPDPVYDREEALLLALCRLAMAEQAIAQKRYRYAQTLLEQAESSCVYCQQALERRRLLLLGRIPGGPEVCSRLPGLDEELLLRAQEAIRLGKIPRAACLLEAMEERDSPRWLLLRGEVYLAGQDYPRAISCLSGAEDAFPEETVPKLEACYRELGDYKQAYLYACKQKRP